MFDLERIIVIGGSLAGLSAARSLRESGFDDHLIVVEAGDSLPVDRPPLSKAVLTGEAMPQDALVPGAEVVESLDLDVRVHHGVEGFSAADCRLKLFNDLELDADAVVVATGSAPRMLELARGLENAFVLRDAHHAVALRNVLDGAPVRVVVGAGFIGLEVAASARSLGHQVTVIESAPTVMARVLPAAVGDAIASLHRSRGVTILTGAAINRLEAKNTTAETVVLADGTRVPVDVLVIGIGAHPCVAWAEGSGLEIADGIVCDATCRASERVWAAGDVAQWYNPAYAASMRVEQWDNAVAMGEYVGKNLIAASQDRPIEPYVSIPWFWSDQYEHKLQMAGRPSAADELVWQFGGPGDDKFVVAFRDGDRCTAVLAMNRPRAAVLARMKMEQSLDWDHVIGSPA